MAQRPALLGSRSSSRSSLESLAYAGHKRPPRASSSTSSRGSTSLSDEVDTRTPFKDSRTTYSAQGSMTLGANRIVIRWETESRAYIHTIPRVDEPASRCQRELLNNQYAFLKSGCGGIVGSSHDVSVKWSQKDEGNTAIIDRDGLKRCETRITSSVTSATVDSLE